MRDLHSLDFLTTSCENLFIFTIQGTHSRFAKAGVSCFYENKVLNPSFVHLMKFSAKNPHLRKAAKRYMQLKKTKEGE